MQINRKFQITRTENKVTNRQKVLDYKDRKERDKQRQIDKKYYIRKTEKKVTNRSKQIDSFRLKGTNYLRQKEAKIDNEEKKDKFFETLELKLEQKLF